ncbi:MAG: hypothetical protein LBB89_12770 [Treponema sp.]|jgi:hypothetical protein|nr:hypothetical protein [Treponema sp.]
MQVPEKYYDEIFDFKGQWDMPSRCGLKIIRSKKTIVIVTELYQDNPGTSVTAAGKILAEQICRNKNLNLNEIMYLECNPNTSSKLSFYDEEFFEVDFSGEPAYRQLAAHEVKSILCSFPEGIN